MPDVDLRELDARLRAGGVEDVRPLTGGASSLTYSGTMDGSRVVIKVAPPGLAPVLHRDVLRQARILRILGSTAVPVPEVLWEDRGEPPGVPPLFVMSFVDGVCVEPLFDEDGDGDTVTVGDRARSAARTMADLHRLEPGGLGLEREPVVGLEAEIERWCRLFETVDPHLVPGWEAVRDALQSSVPVPLDPAIVHGDFRLGNLLASGARITAIVDWEIWSIGDPRIDVGWFLLNARRETYGRVTRAAGAMPPPDELGAEYARAAGHAVPALAWFEALAAFKSAATWSLIVKHNRRRPQPDGEIEAMVATLPRLLVQARERLIALEDRGC